MNAYRSDLLRELDRRGFIHQCTDFEGLDRAAAEGAITAYVGYDCTAPSLHIGNLVSLMMLRILQRAGHRPIALVGGGTTKVGDPTDKTESRKLLDAPTIEANKEGIRRSLAAFLSFEEGGALMVDNDDWLSELRYLDFLRDYGRHFTVNRMLSFDSVRLRLEREQPFSFLEFNYMIMQGYDFLELHRRFGCALQMGGSDQWGNIVNGVELGRRVDGAQLWGLTTPLITTASGEKMGKSLGGAVWLNADMLSPYDYWQFWRNAEDADVGRFMKLFTDLEFDEIARYEALEGAEINDAKIALATEATALAHGRAAAEEAARTAAGLFGAGDGDAPLALVECAGESALLVDLFRQSGLAKSNGEARRLIRGGGAKLDDRPILDEGATIDRGALASGVKLSAGKKRHVTARLAG